MGRSITIDPVTRIEGHARVILEMKDDDPNTIGFAGLVVNELRGFERILVGMEADKLPLVTARICGVCPSAHHLAAVKALDQAAGVEPPTAGKLQRELLYMGHFIHSHAANIFALAGPDLLFDIDAPPAQRNIVGIVEAAPEVAKKALRLRSLGQRINEGVGGRGIHPVAAVVGGMASRLGEDDRARLEAMAVECLQLCGELAPVVKDLLTKRLEGRPELLRDVAEDTYYLGTVNDGHVDFYDGILRAVDSDGGTAAEFESADYDKHLVEEVYDWSYMKPVYLKNGDEKKIYRVGTLARVNCAESFDTELAQAELETFRGAYGRPCHATVMQLYARLIELIHACEKAIALAANPKILGEARVEARWPGGRGVGHVEAPRGTLVHDYEIDEGGIVRAANLIVATQQNYAAINESIRQTANLFVAGKPDDEMLLNGVEFAIRCYDPCLSCATHALGRMPLELEVRRDGELLRRVRRDAR